jgi:hypothetical protein
VVFTGEDSSFVLAGTRQGTLQLWDTRGAGTAVKEINLLSSQAPLAGGEEPGAKTVAMPTVAAVMDIELNADKSTALITVGRKVSRRLSVRRLPLLLLLLQQQLLLLLLRLCCCCYYCFYEILLPLLRLMLSLLSSRCAACLCPA